MKRCIIAAVLAGVMVFSGCIGSASLTTKLYSWNQEATGSKFVNTGILWVLSILPVYEVTVFVDFFILNVIEFWTGSNPIAFSGPQTLEKEVVSNGTIYKLTMGNNLLTIDKRDGLEAGKGITIRYDAATASFYLDDRQNAQMKVGTIKNDKLHLYMPDGQVVTRTLHETVLSSN
ncbi:MAG: DUF3332 domain-containing protein [Chitinispirillaceae bacterium]|nr:DUF3332 domain-containing protein [Chitinispirillaceae bacterium]